MRSPTDTDRRPNHPRRPSPLRHPPPPEEGEEDDGFGDFASAPTRPPVVQLPAHTPHNGVTDPARLRHGVSRASEYLRRRGRPNAFPLTQPCVLHVGYRAISSGLLREVLEVGGGQL